MHLAERVFLCQIFKNKRQLGYDMRMREALEIRRHKCGPGQGLNEDMGAYVKTDIWDTVLNAMG